MKICITAEGDNLDAQIDQRFGRCQYFIFVDTDTLEFEAVANPNLSGMGGVGVQSGQFVAERKAEVVLTGHVGPKAAETLQAAGINVVVDVSGNVKEVVEKYKDGELKASDGPNVEEKSGLDN
ncbi:MAG: NifB/NifX family molybdenum-iron cluster-binding protein [Candidatus Omnitrophica bacterium]|nr:NifB/NifX family molybdenum-iron cluster-binding protein [Candidatus Omnitrophota bacterium]